MGLRIILCKFLFFQIVFGQVPDEICKSFMNSSCVKINLCEPFSNLMMYFERVETREILKKISCGFDGATPKVCCPNSQDIPKEAPQHDILDPSGITLNPIYWKGKERSGTFAPDNIQDKGCALRYGGVALDTIRDKVLEPNTLISPAKSWKSITEPTDTTLNMQGDMNHVTIPLSQDKGGQTEPGYKDSALETIWDKVVEPTMLLEPDKSWKAKNEPKPATLNKDSMQNEIKHTTTPVSSSKVKEIEPGYRGIALNTIWGKVVEPTTLLSPIMFGKPITEPTPSTLNKDSMQGEIKHTTTPVSSSKVKEIEPGYRGIARNTIWGTVVEPTTLSSPIKFAKPMTKPTPTILNKDSMQGENKHATTPLSSTKIRQIEAGYRGIARNTIWDTVVEPTTLLSSIKFLKPINGLIATTLKSNSIQGEMEHAPTPLSSSKVEQIEAGYRGIALDTIWDKVLDTTTLISPIKLWKPINEPTTTSLNTNSKETENSNANSNSRRVWQIEPAIPTSAPDRILDTTQKAFTEISKFDSELETPEINKSSDFIKAFPSPPECGLSNSSFGGRVVDGVDANLGDLPWMALLGYRDRVSVTSWNCGGSLISHRHVLTAAHCIHNHERALYVIRLGELDLAREDDGAIPIDILIKDKIKHELYNPKSYENDIGILVLQKDVQFTDLIKPICMPLDSELRSADLENWSPFIAGWGKTKARGSSATHLQVLQLPVIANKVCTETYKPYENQVIDERVLCVGFMKGGKDSCSGDSGGPLMQPFPQNFTSFFYQIGVISYGVRDCAKPGYPGVYTRITSFMSWLETNVLGAS